MPIPDFIVALRAKIGTDLLWLPGVTAVVFDEDEHVLLTYRADAPDGISSAGSSSRASSLSKGCCARSTKRPGSRWRSNG